MKIGKQLEARVTDIAVLFRMIADEFSVGEEVLGKSHLLLVGVGEFIDHHGIPKQVSRMKKLRTKRKIVAGPQGLLHPKSDVPILIVGEVLHPRRHGHAVGDMILVFRQLARLGFDHLKLYLTTFPGT